MFKTKVKQSETSLSSLFIDSSLLETVVVRVLRRTSVLSSSSGLNSLHKKRSTFPAKPSCKLQRKHLPNYNCPSVLCLLVGGRIVEEIECLAFLLTVEVSLSITGAFNLVRLPIVSTGWPERIGSHRCKRKGQGRSVQILTRSLRGINARADVNNMADFTPRLSNVSQIFFTTFSRRRILCF